MQEVEDNDLVVDAEKHEDETDADPAMQKVQGNDFVVGADPGNKISSPSQYPSMRKMISTANYSRATCVG